MKSDKKVFGVHHFLHHFSLHHCVFTRTYLAAAWTLFLSFLCICLCICLCRCICHCICASLRVYSHIFGCCLGQLPTSQLCITSILTGFPKVVIWICFTISPIFVLYKWYYTNYRFHFVVIWICFTIVTSLYYTNVKTYWWIVGISFSKYISYVQFNLQRDKYEMTLSILI